VAMLCLQSMPYRVREQAVGQMVHPSKTYTDRLMRRNAS
jgi:hypothetical protein